MTHDDSLLMQKFIERCFWWLVGIFGSLLTLGLTSLIGVLWYMNSSILTLNDRVGSAIERLTHQENRASQVDAQLTDHTVRLTTLEALRSKRLPH